LAVRFESRYHIREWDNNEQNSIYLPELSVSTEILQSVDTVKSTGFNISWNRYFISIEVKSQTLYRKIHNVLKFLSGFEEKHTFLPNTFGSVE
jgi:hypothetical protein